VGCGKWREERRQKAVEDGKEERGKKAEGASGRRRMVPDVRKTFTYVNIIEQMV
jgi:hypothetical protein